MRLESNELCRGCLALANGNYCVLDIPYPENCPCIECLVKVTCTKTCEEVKNILYEMMGELI